MKKPLTLMWVVFAVLILYGSLMPFDLHFDKARAAENIRRAMHFWPFGEIKSGKADIVSNVLLYIPLGFLIALAAKINRKDSNALAVFGAMTIGCALSISIELLQSMSQTRVCGAHDFLTNATGTLIGAATACAYSREFYEFISVKCKQYWKVHPVAVAACVLAIALAGDALFPFLPTLRLREIHQNYRNSQFDFSAGLDLHTAGYWIIQQAGAFAFLCMLTCSAIRKNGRPQIFKALVMCALFATVIEAGKIFISNRSINIANVIVAAAGCACGAVFFAALHERLSYAVKILLSAAALLVYMAYLEWGGADFETQRGIVSHLPKGVEWLPLYDYAMSGRGEKVVLFVRTIGISAAFVFTLQLLRFSENYRPKILRWAILMAFIGGIFELGQAFMPDRYPTLTDVFCFAVGGAVGSIFTIINPMQRHMRKSQEHRRHDRTDELLLYRKYSASKGVSAAPPSSQDQHDA